MKILIAEDDFTSRKVMLGHLSRYGDCDIAIDGVEAVEAFKQALVDQQPYDLVCLDIMMPNMDGQDALTQIRQMETQQGIVPGDGAKILMTTALSDTKNILGAFNNQCEGYIVKPVTRDKLGKLLTELALITMPAA